ncbi:AbiH family protein [Niabella beijingensis]|uniref:AbiH family protein n=1 Tax=Niabella beijingensis TaxID=2872700 RepID=UPI001CBBD0A9|nr:AbiH family protein [Niabella beijingensis]MBZ4191706.1 bacteriophage abortive infection AbiH family protein [Niabella beijingensis]
MKKNRLIIIGNGFDIAHGLKTKYSDFIDWLLCSSYNRYEQNNYCHEDDGFCFGNKHAGNRYFIRDKSDITAKEVHAIMKTRSDFFVIKNNFLSQLISKVYDEKKWVDIESTYFIRLLQSFQNYNYAYPYHEAQNESVLNLIRKLHKELDYIMGKLAEYLEIVNAGINEDNLLHDPRANISNVLAPDKEVKTMYLNFNYTDTIIKKSYGYESEVNYIHGRLGYRDNPIVFGYGDEATEEIQRLEHLGVNEYLRKLKSFAYLKAPNYKKLLSFIDSEPFEVHIIGHSCGITDRALLKEIFEHKNCDSIRVFFYVRENGTDSFEETTLEISRHFSNKQLMRRKLVNKDNMDYIPQFKG